MERSVVSTIGKQHFTSPYSPAREVALTKRNILAGWSKAGLFPFNSDRVLSDLAKPPSEQADSEAMKQLAASNAPDSRTSKIPSTPASPITPVTPVSVEALLALQKAMNRKAARSLDQTIKQSLDRHIQKLVKAAHSSFAKIAIQNDQIRFLLAANNEAEVRRSTKSIVLGTAKVMSFEDLVEARTKRSERDAIKHGKSHRRRKQKGGVETESTETERPSFEVFKVVEGSQVSAAVGYTSQGIHLEHQSAPNSFQAPVARMWYGPQDKSTSRAT